jgi:hypothetical protein
VVFTQGKSKILAGTFRGVDGGNMIITEEQSASMLEAAKPLIKWMNENCHPHCTALVDQMRIELVEGVATNATEEFLRD